MKHLAIRFTPTAIVTFSKDDVDFMLVCSRSHYDAVCREASKEAIEHNRNLPGLLCGIRNGITNVGEDYTHKLNFRQLDTLAKIIEMPPPRAVEPRGLAAAITNAMRALNAAVMEDHQLT